MLDIKAEKDQFVVCYKVGSRQDQQQGKTDLYIPGAKMDQYIHLGEYTSLQIYGMQRYSAKLTQTKGVVVISSKRGLESFSISQSWNHVRSNIS